MHGCWGRYCSRSFLSAVDRMVGVWGFPWSCWDSLCHVSLVNVPSSRLLRHQLVSAYCFCCAAVSIKFILFSQKAYKCFYKGLLHCSIHWQSNETMTVSKHVTKYKSSKYTKYKSINTIPSHTPINQYKNGGSKCLKNLRIMALKCSS